MGTTISPLFNGGPTDDEGPVQFPRSATMGDATRLLEGRKGKKKAKQFMKAAEGKKNPAHSKAKKVTKPPVGKNLAKEAKGKKKRGAFGEVYKAAPAPNKGVRVTESRRLRESVSAEDLRNSVQRALSEKYPPQPYVPGAMSPTTMSMSPYVKDIFPDERLVVFTLKEVLWGANYVLDERSGKAKLGNIRRVKVQYVDFGDGETMESREAAPTGKGWERTVKKLKKEPGVDNPFALANWMKGEGHKPAKKESAVA